jgi:hypothetical protein
MGEESNRNESVRYVGLINLLLRLLGFLLWMGPVFFLDIPRTKRVLVALPFPPHVLFSSSLGPITRASSPEFFQEMLTELRFYPDDDWLLMCVWHKGGRKGIKCDGNVRRRS